MQERTATSPGKTRKVDLHASFASSVTTIPESPKHSETAESLRNVSVVQSDFGSSGSLEGGNARFWTTGKVFAYLIFLQIILNFDSGAIPVSLVNEQEGKAIADHFNLTRVEAGSLGALVYPGLAVAGTFAGSVLQTYSAKTVLGVAFAGNMAMAIMFPLSNSKEMLFFSRFVVGFTQSFIMIYAPIWVDDFAPKETATIWMSLVQAGVPVGIMAGYAVGGFLLFSPSLNWRYAFAFQCIMLFILICIWIFIPVDLINLQADDMMMGSPTKSINSDSASSSRFSSIRYSRRLSMAVKKSSNPYEAFQAVFTNSIWVCSVLSICGLYFCVSGIQQLVTVYLQAWPFFTPFETMVLAFSFICSTGPISGVLVGGWVTDNIVGGYTVIKKAAGAGVVFGSLATVSALLCIVIRESMILISVCIWFLLFFGGAVVPIVTGILVSCLDRDLRPIGSSLSISFYNMFGYFLGPILSSSVSDWLGEKCQVGELVWLQNASAQELIYGDNTVTGATLYSITQIVKDAKDAPSYFLNGTDLASVGRMIYDVDYPPEFHFDKNGEPVWTMGYSCAAKATDLTWGWRILMLSSLISLAAMIVIWKTAKPVSQTKALEESLLTSA